MSLPSVDFRSTCLLARRLWICCSSPPDSRISKSFLVLLENRRAKWSRDSPRTLGLLLITDCARSWVNFEIRDSRNTRRFATVSVLAPVSRSSRLLYQLGNVFFLPMLFSWVLRTTHCYNVTCFKAKPSSTLSRLLSRSIFTSFPDREPNRSYALDRSLLFMFTASKLVLHVSKHRESLRFVDQRPPPPELWDGSQPSPSMPAWSHFGET
ncbi:hypothetical protein F2Q69_00018508 [Brassica cretica]|uniref:Uncharacterized protein n=1 Tax=Brassica cretica TaxID=69181 RepID=A0A8S9QBE6_BRACR|nr:hypothetical protein F2Q69_00018508 [Brassica cretica]